MPLQNRVLPDGSIVADPARGLLTGNRGILHDDSRTLRHRWTAKAWICCVLSWKETRRTPMTGRSWTELFFLDEAVALAAGHRPCATCRRAAYNAFRAAWSVACLPGTKATEIDTHLHALRLTETRHQRLHLALADTLPDGTFIRFPAPRQHIMPAPLLDGTVSPDAFPHDTHGATLSGRTCVLQPRQMVDLDARPLTAALPHLLLGRHAFPYRPAGYLSPLPRPQGPVLVMTPAPTVAALGAGYRPILHPSAF